MPVNIQLEKRVAKLERSLSEIREIVGLLPPLIKPFEWKGLTARDRGILSFLIKQPKYKQFTTTQIAGELGFEKPSVTGRVHVWNSLKRIQRIAGKKRKRILDHDRKAKTWALNKWDFMYPGDPTRLTE